MAQQREPVSQQRKPLQEFAKLARQSFPFVWSKNGSLRVAAPKELKGFWTAWSDGSYESSSHKAAIGGLVRNERGEPMALFSRAIEISAPCSAPTLESERQALLEALAIAAEAGATRVEARLDCLPLLVRLINFERIKNSPQKDSAEYALTEALSRFEEVALRWIPRELNQLADALSKRPAGKGALFGGSPGIQVFNKALATGEAFNSPTLFSPGETIARLCLPSPLPRPSSPISNALRIGDWALGASLTENGGWSACCSKLAPTVSAKKNGEEPGSGSLTLPRTANWGWGDCPGAEPLDVLGALERAFAQRLGKDVDSLARGSFINIRLDPPLSGWLEERSALPALAHRLELCFRAHRPEARVVLISDAIAEPLSARAAFKRSSRAVPASGELLPAPLASLGTRRARASAAAIARPPRA